MYVTNSIALDTTNISWLEFEGLGQLFQSFSNASMNASFKIPAYNQEMYELQIPPTP